ncbi:FCRLA protein, partial [Xiphorhynchus elegans]|nr:FCRLA protein [Xiphorhynchus elegans]
LVLQVTAGALLEGDTVTLRCRARGDISVTQVWFFHERKKVAGPLKGTEISLRPLQLHHGGRYRCRGKGDIWSKWNELSAPVTVRV